jgi:hypothetical protein
MCCQMPAMECRLNNNNSERLDSDNAYNSHWHTADSMSPLNGDQSLRQIWGQYTQTAT